MAKKDASVAVIAGIGLFVSLQTLNRYDLNNSLRAVLGEQSMPEAGVEGESGEVVGVEEQVMEGEPMPLEEEVTGGCSSGVCSLNNNFKDGYFPQYADSTNAHVAREFSDEIGGYDMESCMYADV